MVASIPLIEGSRYLICYLPSRLMFQLYCGLRLLICYGLIKSDQITRSKSLCLCSRNTLFEFWSGCVLSLRSGQDPATRTHLSQFNPVPSHAISLR